MPSITPPTLEQIKLMRETIDKSKAFVIPINDTMHMDSVASFIIWDDENEIVHLIDPNTSLATQFEAPVRMRHVSYDQIESFVYEI